ncbi:TPA: AAA family ATPase [Haemophilus influenzae]|uniref:AAA family ATPase n=1 Tax=Haemophilus influenzae TaxID=727 RepID=UPI0003155A5E|nr:ATP-binding protein [Haemophilus influenzae]CVQ41702.1 DNA-binding protein [Streptococcus pneumoniae]MCK9021842.1 ATP-binding protein [Haemophilus influenzae]MCK9044911.1 ATP-binding protein [Haemophilus influenzae]TWV00974.1 ATP-binding protein [Haemophilus influenzae]CWW80775.1 serine/threonine protein phosphatase family protein [Haemophilus influenzae]
MSEYKLNPPTVSSYTENMMLKVLFEHKGFSEVFRETSWRSDEIASAFGLPEELENDKNLRTVARRLLKERYKTLQKSTALLPELWKQAYENLATLAEFLQLNPVEQELLRFAMHLRSEGAMRDLFGYLPKSDLQRTAAIMADLLKQPKNQILSALKKGSKLDAYDLIDRDYRPDSVHDYLDWGETLDFDEFVTQPLNENVLLKSCTEVAQVPSLQLDDFAHIAGMKEMMLTYLQQALKHHRKGVNLLIYGVPGTGKTEFAGLLAQALGISAYNITYMDSDGDVVKAEQRLNYSRLAQTLLNGKQALLIFDEIEDVFNGSFMERSVAQKNKAWTNQLLENNNVPMIWLSNSVSGIDPAFLRRFDFILEMPDLPLKNKSALITQLTEGKLSPAYVQHFAKVRSLTPAILSRTIRVVKELNTSNFAETLLMMFNQTLKSQNKPKIEPLVLGKADYNLDYVACNDNIHRISEGLKRSKKGRICCYGPPGTGKTAWAAWLAEQLDMPLLLRQGSDLLNPYVGGTEQNIAQAFEQAKADNAILVLDEVDTFLFSREGANRSWERSQVNEMLTQIERFEGLMVVSTNLIEVLDPAALRRFDLKLKFDYLTLKQRLDFAKQQAEILGLPLLSEEDLSQIESLNLLTPGDFAAVARRHQFSPFHKVQDWLMALQGECEVKPAFSATARRIGF